MLVHVELVRVFCTGVTCPIGLRAPLTRVNGARPVDPCPIDRPRAWIDRGKPPNVSPVVPRGNWQASSPSLASGAWPVDPCPLTGASLQMAPQLPQGATGKPAPPSLASGAWPVDPCLINMPPSTREGKCSSQCMFSLRDFVRTSKSCDTLPYWI